MIYRVVLSTEDGTVLSKQTFTEERDMISHMESIRENADEIYKHTRHKILILSNYYMVKHDWVEDDVESLLL